jgi:hypothetical protein
MVIKILRLLHLGFFLGFFYFQIFPFSFFETNFVKKVCSQTVYQKSEFAALCFMHVFCQISSAIFSNWTKNKCPKSKTANESRSTLFRGFQIWDFIQ